MCACVCVRGRIVEFGGEGGKGVVTGLVVVDGFMQQLSYFSPHQVPVWYTVK